MNDFLGILLIIIGGGVVYAGVVGLKRKKSISLFKSSVLKLVLMGCIILFWGVKKMVGNS